MKKQMKNEILKGSVVIAIIIMVTSASCFDGDSILIPVIANYISIFWLFIMYLANK